MLLTRKLTSLPNSPMRIMMSDPANGDLLNAGGTFYFAPGESHQVSEYFATEVMKDPGLAEHFDCNDLQVASKQTTDATDGGEAGLDQTARKPRRQRGTSQQADPGTE